MYMSKSIRDVNSMQAGPKRQMAIKSLTKKGTVAQGKPGKPLATLGSNAAVRKGKMNTGSNMGKTRVSSNSVVKANTKSRVIKAKNGAGGPIGKLGGKVAGRMNTGGKARRVS